MRRLMPLFGIVALSLSGAVCLAQGTNETPKTPLAAQATAPSPLELKTDKDKTSYALGMEFGSYLKQMGDDAVDVAVLIRAIQDMVNGAKPQLTEAESRDVMTAFQKSAMEKVHARMNELGEKSKKLGMEFLGRNAKAEGVKTTSSGLQYKVIKQGTGPAPKPADTVKVRLQGRLIDGTPFGDSKDEAVELPLAENKLPPGLSEGIQPMKEGAETVL